MRRPLSAIAVATLAVLPMVACNDDGASGPDLDAFCAAFAEIAASDLANAELPSGDDIRGAVDAAGPLFDRLRDRAPAAVATDAASAVDAFATARSFLERIDFDESRLAEVTTAEGDAFVALRSVTSVESPVGRFAAANCTAPTSTP